MRFVLNAAAVCGLLALAVAVAPPVRSADHGDAPEIRKDTRSDINDVYVFQSPENPENTVFVMTVCPFAGITGPTVFANGVKYEFAIDTNGDAREDFVYSFTFSKPKPPVAERFKMNGPGTLAASGGTGGVAAFANNGRVFCGTRDDPFFFDLLGFRKGLSFSVQTSRNFFVDVNTLAIVIEIPTSSLGTLTNSTMGVWARTVKGRRQLDRNGRPAINTVLIPGVSKDAFNATSPRDDVERWRSTVIATLTAAPFNRTAQDAGSLADVLLPDILTYDPTNSGGFLNGRKLTDDVIDAELGLLSNNAVTTDFVGSDSPFVDTFPYLGASN